MMSTFEFVAQLDQQDIKLWLDGDRLRINAPEGTLSPKLIAQLKERKMEIMAFLREHQGGSLATTIEPLDEIKRLEPLPLSFAQQRLWFLAQLEETSNIYNIPTAFRLCGPLDVALFAASCRSICERHEALRTTFAQVDGQARQKINETSFNPELIDLSDLPSHQQEAEVARLSRQEAKHPFDLMNGPLWRVTLLRLGKEEHVLLLTMHHIISDGWSIDILMRDLSALYAQQKDTKRASLPELPIQYADFAVWQRKWLTGDILQQHLAYWKEQLADAPPLLTLPTDHPRPAVQSHRGDHLSFTLSGELSQELKRLSQKHGTTLFMTLQAAFAVLLSRYSGQEDILIGTPIANRQAAEVENLIGFFLNTLVLRNDLSGNPTFGDFLAKVRQVTLDAYQQQALPFELLVDTLQPERSLSYSPLFQVMCTLENSPSTLTPEPVEGRQAQDGARSGTEKAPSFSDLTVTPIEVEYPVAKFDLMLAIQDLSPEEGLIACWEYNTDLFERTTIERMAGHFKILLEGIVANPDQAIARLPLLTEREKHQLLVEWNKTDADYPKEKCIHQLFEQHAAAERTPDAVALVFNDDQLTYRELNARANQLAHYLIAQGVGPDVLVGICVPRSVEMVVGLLGILKAGGAYVPLDPEYPQERIQFMLDDANVKVLLTTSELSTALGHDAFTVCLDQPLPGNIFANPNQNHSSTQLAYVLYTSGSTGRPKGVAIEHRSPVALFSWADTIFCPEELAGVLASTSICFDLSVFELFLPLTRGGKVILAENALALPSLQDVVLVNTVPSAMKALVEEGQIPNSVRVVNLAGEPLKNKLVQQIYALGQHGEQATVQKVFNLYGPSEDTTYSTYALIEKGAKTEPTIGRPISNTQAYILDAHLQPVPIGVPGELHLGGAGLARGYLNRPQLTKDKFIPNPFGPGKLYKTGDLCRYLPDGSIEFLGRADYQVKIRGFRIELGEIETTLASHPNVREAVVVVREEKVTKRLVAYVVIEDGIVAKEPISSSTLQAYLGEKLPHYMIPNAFVQLKAMPLTPNGKINRRALPTPREAYGTTFVMPQTEIEQQIAAVWQSILQLDKVGLHDNFFEIGGNSLLIVQLQSKLRSALGYECAIVNLFQYPTVETLAQYLSQSKNGEVNRQEQKEQDEQEEQEEMKARLHRRRNLRRRRQMRQG